MLSIITKNQTNFVRDNCPWLTPEKNQFIKGNTESAMAVLDNIDPIKYCQTRNYLSGAVTHLSAYIKHGIFSLKHIRHHALNKVNNPKTIEKFIQELAWREFWQRLYKAYPNYIWNDIESYKTGFIPNDYLNELPNDISSYNTPNACINQFIKTLIETGYLHNHARMYLAAYIVHWRRVKWQVGAKWMHHYLIDGDLASNNFSWQWVASTFSHKPYIFNLNNVKKYSDSSIDTLAKHNPELDFDYPVLMLKLFPNKRSYE